MKKLMFFVLLVGGIVLVMVGAASAHSIGNDIIDRNKVDTYQNFTMIDLGLQFDGSGRIDSWSLFAENTGDVYLQTFRFDGSDYSIVGENYVNVDTSGVNTFDIQSGDEIEYQSGDYIGWTFTNVAVFGYDGEGDLAKYTGDGAGVTGVDSLASFVGETYRTYSVAADAVPTPEPSTLLLLGGGLAGLGLYTRKRKKA